MIGWLLVTSALCFCLGFGVCFVMTGDLRFRIGRWQFASSRKCASLYSPEWAFHVGRGYWPGWATFERVDS